jgi:heme/copper-type cytochrome/quinol oxidase subunit 4
MSKEDKESTSNPFTIIFGLFIIAISLLSHSEDGSIWFLNALAKLINN